MELYNKFKNLKVNENLKIKVIGDSKKNPVRNISGQVICKTKSFITIDMGTYKESFTYSDFLTRRAIVI